MPRHSLPQLALPRFSPTPQVLAGAVVASGELDGVVLDTGANTFFGKTMALLAQPQERGHLNIVLGEQQGAWAQCGMADWLGSLGGEAGSCLHVVRQGRPSSLGCGGGLIELRRASGQNDRLHTILLANNLFTCCRPRGCRYWCAGRRWLHHYSGSDHRTL